MKHSSLHTLFLLSLIALLCSLLAGSCFGATDEGEAKVKTAYIYNFSKYTTWPAPHDTGPLNICLLNAGILSKQLVALEKRRVKFREISVRTLSRKQTPTECGVLFIGDVKDDTLPAILNEIQTSPILTISDRPGFAKQGGMIELFRKGSKIRFIINTASVDRAGLSISSRLLALATIIRGGEGR